MPFIQSLAQVDGYSLVLDFKGLTFSPARGRQVRTSKGEVLPGSPRCVIFKHSGSGVNLGLSPGSEFGSCDTLKTTVMWLFLHSEMGTGVCV